MDALPTTYRPGAVHTALLSDQQDAITAAIKGTAPIDRTHTYDEIGDRYLGLKIVVGIIFAVALGYLIWYIKKHR